MRANLIPKSNKKANSGRRIFCWRHRRICRFVFLLFLCLCLFCFVLVCFTRNFFAACAKCSSFASPNLSLILQQRKPICFRPNAKLMRLASNFAQFAHSEILCEKPRGQSLRVFAHARNKQPIRSNDHDLNPTFVALCCSFSFCSCNSRLVVCICGSQRLRESKSKTESKRRKKLSQIRIASSLSCLFIYACLLFVCGLRCSQFAVSRINE